MMKQTLLAELQDRLRSQVCSNILTEGIRTFAVIKTLLPQSAPLCTCQPGIGPVLYVSLAALTQEHVQRSGSTETGWGTTAGFQQETAYEWQSRGEGMDRNCKYAP